MIKSTLIPRPKSNGKNIEEIVKGEKRKKDIPFQEYIIVILIYLTLALAIFSAILLIFLTLSNSEKPLDNYISLLQLTLPALFFYILGFKKNK